MALLPYETGCHQVAPFRSRLDGESQQHNIRIADSVRRVDHAHGTAVSQQLQPGIRDKAYKVLGGS